MAAPKYPKRTPGVERISNSELQTYLVCGLRWLYDREDSHRRTTVAAACGTGVHAGAKRDNLAKKNEGAAIEAKEIVEVSVDAYEREVGECEVDASPHEIDAGVDDTANAAREYALRIAPLYEPKEILDVERAVVARVGGFEIAGTPDAMTSDGVGDVKTGRPWTAARARSSRQLTLYGFLYRAAYGEAPSRVWIDGIARPARGGWVARRIYDYRQTSDYTALREILVRALEGMRAGIALPAAEGDWHCQQKYCPHYRRCTAVVGRR